MITKKDYWVAAAAGFATGILLLFILSLLKKSFPFQYIFAIIIIPILWAIGVWFGGFLSKWPALPDGSRGRFPFFAQFGKYAAAGFLSTAIDFAVLNYLSHITGVTAGVVIGWVNVPGFLVAVTNGYMWNKLWVFKDYDGEGLFRDFPKFFAVGVGGLVINSVLIILLTTYMPITIINAVGSSSWLNVSKLVANIVVIIWNFIGFKFLVFKK